VLSDPVILVGGHCCELRVNKLERLDVAAAATERDVRSTN